MEKIKVILKGKMDENKVITYHEKCSGDINGILSMLADVLTYLAKDNNVSEEIIINNIKKIYKTSLEKEDK